MHGILNDPDGLRRVAFPAHDDFAEFLYPYKNFVGLQDLRGNTDSAPSHRLNQTSTS